MVEGGSILLQSFIDAGCWDEAYIECSHDHLKEGVKAPVFSTGHTCLTKKMFGKDIKHVINKGSKHENPTE